MRVSDGIGNEAYDNVQVITPSTTVGPWVDSLILAFQARPMSICNGRRHAPSEAVLASLLLTARAGTGDS